MDSVLHTVWWVHTLFFMFAATRKLDCLPIVRVCDRDLVLGVSIKANTASAVLSLSPQGKDVARCAVVAEARSRLPLIRANAVKVDLACSQQYRGENNIWGVVDRWVIVVCRCRMHVLRW